MIDRTARLLRTATALTCGMALVPAVAHARTCHTAGIGDSVAPAWVLQPRMTVLVDSVLLGGAPKLRSSSPCRRVDVRGRPALMLRVAEAELRRQRRGVAPLVVIGLGYNSLWERGRRNHGRWAARFDGEAARLLATLRRLGARQFVWVTLREPRASYLTPAGRGELGKYSWYFPWVNERLRRLDRRHDDLVLADWAAVSHRPGLTYDSIHLNPTGALLMARTIRRAIRDEALRQSRKPEQP